MEIIDRAVIRCNVVFIRGHVRVCGSEVSPQSAAELSVLRMRKYGADSACGALCVHLGNVTLLFGLHT